MGLQYRPGRRGCPCWLVRSLAAEEVEAEVVEELRYEEQGVRVVGQLPCCNGLEVSQQLGRFG